METNKNEQQAGQEQNKEIASKEVSLDTLEKDLSSVSQDFLHAESKFEEKLATSYSTGEIAEAKSEIGYDTSINEINSEFNEATGTAGGAPEQAAMPEAVPMWKQRKELEKQELQEVGEIAYDFIREHCKALGVDVGAFSKDAIDWDEVNGNSKAHYSYKFNHIMTKSSSLHVLIHEEMHYAASAKNSEAGKIAAEEGTAPEKRWSKTGFVSTWGKSEENAYSNFRSLNEAVTEKMAREILGKNKDRFEEEYKKRNFKSIEQKKKFAQDYYDQQKAEWDANSKDMYALYEWANDGETYEDFYNSKLADFEKSFENTNDKIPFNPDVLKDVEKVYENEINIFDAMLDKLARHRATTEQISESEAYTKEWTELQQAYLQGNTMALRRIDQVLGPGTLREFNEIDLKLAKTNDTAYEEYHKKIDALMAKLKS